MGPHLSLSLTLSFSPYPGINSERSVYLISFYYKNIKNLHEVFALFRGMRGCVVLVEENVQG